MEGLGTQTNNVAEDRGVLLGAPRGREVGAAAAHFVYDCEVLERDGWRGLMTFTLAESLWLAGEGFDDLLLAYPTADRAALARVREAPPPGPILMVDSVEHLDLIAHAGGQTPTVRVCIDVD